MKESAFQRRCVETATRFGWVAKHVPTPMRPTAGGRFVPDSRGRGLLDLILIHEDPPRLIFAECKNEVGVLSDEQKKMLRLLRQVADIAVDVNGHRTIGVYVWFPGVEDLVETILRSKVMVEQ